MILTKSHLQFYREKKLPAPKWGLESNPVSVHELINSQDPIRRKMKNEPNTLIHLIRLVQSHKQETVIGFLKRLAYNPCRTDTPRRVGYARKWYAHLQREL